MNLETNRALLRHEPFKPVVIRLSSGEAHEVRHPECAALKKLNVIVTYPDEDRDVHCGLIHVSAVELLQNV